ncbi:hypothetical protein DSTSK_17800 [Desulforhabdus sp. TSK]|nr:hypothetical protein DSTSK_17800 [Desulforhabdus sp. TSK]
MNVAELKGAVRRMVARRHEKLQGEYSDRSQHHPNSDSFSPMPV